jgi:hypothetical protein
MECVNRDANETEFHPSNMNRENNLVFNRLRKSLIHLLTQGRSLLGWLKATLFKATNCIMGLCWGTHIHDLSFPHHLYNFSFSSPTQSIPNHPHLKTITSFQHLKSNNPMDTA